MTSKKQAEYNKRMDMIHAAIDDADDVDGGMAFALLAAACADWLAQWDAETRSAARDDLVSLIDDMTKDNVIESCDAWVKRVISDGCA